MPIEQNFNKPDLDLVNLEPVFDQKWFNPISK